MTTPLLAALLVFALLLAVLFGILLLFFLSRTRALERAVNEGREREAQLDAERSRLAQYEGVADADEVAAAMLRDAQVVLDGAKLEAQQTAAEASRAAAAAIQEAQQAAASALSLAREQAKATRQEAQGKLDGATLQAARIVEDATKRAEEIAGSAYEAMKNASMYEDAVKAMKNIIDGYGDQYIVPRRSLLDELAEDFGYTEAGQELKRARERSALMIRNGTAATCDYVESGRRDTAIRFVVDAFNGKVDSILSRAKHDNVGTLEREIRDAFTLVNLNGKAFRDARVTDAYLAARLDELKWGGIAQQLRLEEREEQRRIKEQMREEAKAQREYEAAMRSAAKEEDLIRKGMEKAQQQVAKANAEQKAKYEQQLLELTQRLQEVEARNQRALSMAQQTKRGNVYIISNIGSFGEHVYKIGLTRRLEPEDRVRELGDSSVPFEFDIHAMLPSSDAPALETRLHRHFVLMQVNKVNPRKEFFRVDLAHVREEVEKMGVGGTWTMAAQAQEYRETLAIEKAIREDPARREAWVQDQLDFEPSIDTDVEAAAPES